MVENAGRKSRKQAPGLSIISQDNKDLLSGTVTLAINPGAGGDKIRALNNALNKNSAIRMVSTGGVAGKGSWSCLHIQCPASLYEILYRIPEVQQVARKGNEIQVTVLKDEQVINTGEG